jgi:hypothetical protein
MSDPGDPRSAAAAQAKERWAVHERNNIERQVKDHGLTPSDAERWASDHGQDRFAQLLDHHTRELEKRLWPLPLAVIWIAFRNRKSAAEVWADFCFWRGHIYRDAKRDDQLLTLSRAEFDLFQELSSGEKIDARGRPERQAEREIWHESWDSVSWDNEDERTTMIMGDGSEMGDITIPKDKMIALWPATRRKEKADEGSQKGPLTKGKLKRFFESLDGKHTVAEYTKLAEDEFPSSKISRGPLLAALAQLPPDKKFVRGESPKKSPKQSPE